MFFGNRTIGLHILKGILGLAALYGSLSTMSRTIWPSLILLPVVLYLLQGCPLCWTMGLIETVAMTVHKRNERKVAAADYQPKANLSGLASKVGSNESAFSGRLKIAQRFYRWGSATIRNEVREADG